MAENPKKKKKKTDHRDSHAALGNPDHHPNGATVK